MEPGPLSHRSQTVVDAARLHRARSRRERNETLIEGPHLLTEALEAGASISAVYYVEEDHSVAAARAAGAPVAIVSDQALRRLAGTETPRGPVAVVAVPPEKPLQSDLVLVSWGVSDPGNVGTMIRTAAAFGWGFAYTTGTADPWSPKVLRAGVGLQFSTPIFALDGLAGLGDRQVWAATVSGGASPSDVPGGRIAVLIGEEASGLPDEIVKGCDGMITIDMPGGAESLNAAVAAGIIVHELSNRGGETGHRV